MVHNFVELIKVSVTKLIDLSRSNSATRSCFNSKTGERVALATKHRDSEATRRRRIELRSPAIRLCFVRLTKKKGHKSTASHTSQSTEAQVVASDTCLRKPTQNTQGKSTHFLS